MYDSHISLGGQMTPYAGYLLPMKYEGMITEALRVRQECGVFDVSHMGEIFIKGPRAFDFLQNLLPNDMSRLKKGRAVYSPMLNNEGGIIDDLIAYPYNDGYLLVVNASNIEKDFLWIVDNAGQVEAYNLSENFSQIALQGRDSLTIMNRLGFKQAEALPFFGCSIMEADGIKGLVSRTGYTGEPGFELYLSDKDGAAVWNRIIELGVMPCGLGARDILRLEAALPLYSHELSEDINAYEAGLERFIKPDKGDFIGRGALLKIKESGVLRRLIGISTGGRAIPRAGHEVYDGDGKIGYVTSGGVSPVLGENVAMVLAENKQYKEDLFIPIRGKNEPFKLTGLPFYSGQNSSRKEK